MTTKTFCQKYNELKAPNNEKKNGKYENQNQVSLKHKKSIRNTK